MPTATLSEDDVQIILKKRFGAQDFKLLSWNKRQLGEGDVLGFCGGHFRLETTVRSQDHDETLSFFVKTKPDNPVQQEHMTTGSQGVKELAFFTKLADKLDSILSRIRPMAPGSNLPIIPKCYLATEDLIVLEDLHSLNCQMVQTKDSSSLLDLLRVSLRAVARFHAAGIVLEEETGRTFLEDCPEMDFEPFLDASPDHPQASWHAASVRAAAAIVPLLDKYKDQPEIVARTQDALPGLVKDLMGKMRPWPSAKNVLTHGDLWVNNVLCRLDADNKPTEAVLVDYQLVRYAPPATDIVMFLMYSADKNFRDEHSETLVREYYKELTDALLQLGVQPEKVLPWDELERTLRETQKYGLALMLIEFPIILAPAEAMESVMADAEKYRQHFLVDRTDFSVKLFQEDSAFRARFTEIMEELIDNYISTPAQAPDRQTSTTK